MLSKDNYQLIKVNVERIVTVLAQLLVTVAVREPRDQTGSMVSLVRSF